MSPGPVHCKEGTVVLMTPTVRATIALALLFAAARAWAEPRHHAPSARRASLKNPFRNGLAPLPDGPLAHFDGHPHLAARQYRDLSAAAQHLLKEFPPEKHYFIGLGRDPTPIIAFLQNLGGRRLAINLPASSNESGYATKELMRDYVKRFVPAGVLESGRTVVFVDVTKTGRGLDYYVPLIAPSLNGAKLIRVAFGAEGSAVATVHPTHVIDTWPFQEVDKFLRPSYEVLSQYPRHGPGVDPIGDLDTPRPAYREYRRVLLQRMRRDEGLRDFVERSQRPSE